VEILLEVLVHLKQISNAGLANCLLVNKTWCKLARPLLYNNVTLLSCEGMLKFSKQFNFKAHGSKVRSLALRLRALDRLRPTYQVDEPLHMIAESICKLEALTTFSLVVDLGAEGFYTLSQRTLSPLIRALPASCINLELDTRTYDEPTNMTTGPHLCTDICAILPRMHNVRLRLRTMCAALLTTGIEGSSTEPLTYLSLPNIRSLVISCRTLSEAPAGECGVPWLLGTHPPRTAWDIMTRTLDDLEWNTESISPTAKIYVFDGLWEGDQNDACYHPTFLRTDMVAQTTHAFPVITLGGSLGVTTNGPRLLLRKIDGKELGAPDFPTLEAWAEGQVWSDVACGARLPTELVFGEGRRMPVAQNCTMQRLQVRCRDTWRGRLPYLTSHLWYNESLSRRKLLFGEVREGEDFLFRGLVAEDTPPGFYRLASELYRRLYSFSWD
jgi:hypothetical protein